MKRSHIVAFGALAPALLATPLAAPAKIADLFYTPQQQAALARHASRPQATPSGRAATGDIVVEGVWSGPTGRRYAIINGRPVVAGDHAGGAKIETISVAAVRLRQPDEPRGRWLRVGEAELSSPRDGAPSATVDTSAMKVSR